MVDKDTFKPPYSSIYYNTIWYGDNRWRTEVMKSQKTPILDPQGWLAEFLCWAFFFKLIEAEWHLYASVNWDFNQNRKFFTHEHASENIVSKMVLILSWPQCVKSLCYENVRFHCLIINSKLVQEENPHVPTHNPFSQHIWMLSNAIRDSFRLFHSLLAQP